MRRHVLAFQKDRKFGHVILFFNISNIGECPIFSSSNSFPFLTSVATDHDNWKCLNARKVLKNIYVIFRINAKACFSFSKR